MTTAERYPFDPKFDLVLERDIDVSPELVWKAWTIPEHLVKWFTPAPWQTSRAEIELYPGGRFLNVMRSPEGNEMEYLGSYLEVAPNERLVWTMALLPGFRPAAHPEDALVFTAVISMEPNGRGGTLYKAHAMHKSEAMCTSHNEMGFHDGWGSALDQLVEYGKTL